jgi:hypothetical protein
MECTSHFEAADQGGADAQQVAARVGEPRPKNVAVVAMANKIARTSWALLAGLDEFVRLKSVSTGVE